MFTVGELASIKRLRIEGCTFAEIWWFFPRYDRKDMIEAWWATLRHDSAHAALGEVRMVLAAQECDLPLINGKPAYKVSMDRGRVSYSPMF